MSTLGRLLGLPALLHMRAVFVGSRGLMPGLSFPGSGARAGRPRTTAKHTLTADSVTDVKISGARRTYCPNRAPGSAIFKCGSKAPPPRRWRCSTRPNAWTWPSRSFEC